MVFTRAMSFLTLSGNLHGVVKLIGSVLHTQMNRSFFSSTSLLSSSAADMARISLAFILFTTILSVFLLDDLRLDGQLVAGQTQRLTGNLFGHAAISKQTRPGFTTATQYSGSPYRNPYGSQPASG